MNGETFDPWLGAIGQDRSLYQHLSHVAYRHGWNRTLTPRPRTFDGSRIGRGAGIGRILASRVAIGGGRRASIHSRVVRFWGPNQAHRAISGHLSYLQRGGAGRSGERAMLYSAEEGRELTPAGFARSACEDRHQFRLIVAADDDTQYASMKPLVRQLLRQVSQDLHVGFDWVAADHYDTGHLHSHVTMRGKGNDGNDLVIAREYLQYGLSARAAAQIQLDLGPRSLDIDQPCHDLEAERMTPIDRRLLQSIDRDGTLTPHHSDHSEESRRIARLRLLEGLQLARQEDDGRWWLDRGLESKLDLIAGRNDRVGSIERAVRETSTIRMASSYQWTNGDPGQKRSIIGRLISCQGAQTGDGLELVVDGMDGRVHFLQSVAGSGLVPMPGAIVRVDKSPDREVELPNGVGQADGMKGERERSDPVRAAAYPTGDGTGPTVVPIISYGQVTILSQRPLSELPGSEEATWLDNVLLEMDQHSLQQGFGADVARALRDRTALLETRGLVQRHGNSVHLTSEFIAKIRAREVVDLGVRPIGLAAGKIIGQARAPDIST